MEIRKVNQVHGLDGVNIVIDVLETNILWSIPVLVRKELVGALLNLKAQTLKFWLQK